MLGTVTSRQQSPQRNLGFGIQTQQLNKLMQKHNLKLAINETPLKGGNIIGELRTADNRSLHIVSPSGVSNVAFAPGKNAESILENIAKIIPDGGSLKVVDVEPKQIIHRTIATV